ncbi:MAG: DUF4912 domain-containing protein [Verrucomicrobia bacterium]|nr:DUF4912 domain-containing protein [Verrucomicrobiota bacterium]
MKTKKTSLGDKTKASAGPRPAARKLAVKKSPAPVSRPATGRKMAAKPKAAPIKVAKPKTVTRKALPEIPAILLETERSGPSVSGPGEKFALGPTPPVQHFESEATELPTAYGTGRLFLTARDPHWLYANWDLTRDQQLRYNAFSTDGHLILRIYVGAVRGEPVAEIHVHPESRHWFAHVERAETRYAAELGYYEAPRQWTTIATSGATLTPPDTISPDTTFSFATIPVEVSFARLVAIVQRAAYENTPLAQAVEELRKSGHPELPSGATAPVAEWTPAQERALAAVINVDHVRRVWIGSLEITELIRRQLESEISSIGVARFGLPSSPGGAVTSISSPFGGEQAREKGFWFNVNAELIIYGATERDATVTIGGRKIKLRPDGSFSYRFALPDGRYDLPVVAVSADGTDGRAAELKFSRQTEIRGDVGTHPQDPRLKPPTPENV